MKGRRPGQADSVIPMREGDQPGGHNLEERAAARLAEILPEGLEGATLWTFRRLALPLCHPTRDRLHAGNVFMFLQLVRAVVRHERLITELEELGETYETKTRDGMQAKARPQVAQLNETFRQIRALAGEFGMTPATERALAAGSQMGFRFPADDPGAQYLT